MMLEIVMILDQSGSMYPLKKDTVGGFNSLIEKQKREEGEVLVSTLLFDNECKVLHDRLPLQEVPLMTDDDYCPGGSTALLDTLGDAIRHIGNIHKYARKEDIPEKTLFFIITDGMENASRRYSYAEIRSMIRKREQENGWEFIYLCSDLGAEDEAERMGIRPERMARCREGRKATAENYACLSAITSAARFAGDASEDIGLALEKIRVKKEER